MLTDEAPQVQEVRYCLKTLREQMAARQNNNNKGLEEKAKGCINLAEFKNLYSHLQENDTLEAEQRELQRLFLEKQNSRMQKAETKVKEQEEKMKEMQMLMDSLKLENATLQKQLSANEAELEKLQKSDERCEQLKKQLESQQYKNCTLDDMLKCQYRKLRNMMEQVQNAQTSLDIKNRQVSDLKEKVSFVEAENNELHDRLNHLDQ